jgi:3-methylfumaryl-CoA hydratase
MADAHFSDWLGREQLCSDLVTAGPLARLAATLDHDGLPWPDGELPPLGHWLFHLPDGRQSTLGEDGHPERGGFLPPATQPRRMWVGGRVSFNAPIRVGQAIKRRSRIASVEQKPGKSGEMLFVTVHHSILADDVAAVEEDQLLAFIPHAPPADGDTRPLVHPEPDSCRALVADPLMLFRFSALTFNAHRIHYDLPYARAVEGYPELVVHGPLQAMLIVDHLLRDLPDARISSFAFRARAPLFAGAGFDVCRSGEEAWVRSHAGVTSMTATVTFA